MQKKVAILALVLALSGCADRSQEQMKHNPAAPSDALATTATSSESVSSGLELSQNINSENAAELVASTIQPLVSELFQRSYLRNKKTITSDRAARQLNMLNKSLLQANKIDSKLLLDSGALKQYAEAIEEGCVPGTLQYCRNLPFFKLDIQSAAVAKLIAEAYYKDDVRGYYRFLRIANELSERTSDPDLDRLFIARSIELFKTYASIVKNPDKGNIEIHTENLNRKDIDELRVYVEFTATVLLKNSSNPDFQQNNLKEIFQLILGGNLNNTFGPTLGRQYLRLVAKELKTDALWGDFKELVRIQENAPQIVDRPNERGITPLYLSSSYSNAARELEQKNPEALKLLGVPAQDPFTDYREKDDLIYFYIVSRIFEKQARSSIMPLWEASAKNQHRFGEILENYVRVYFAHSSMATNKKMAELFRMVETNGVNSKEFLVKSMKDVRTDVEPLWSDFFKRVQQLEGFFKDEIEQKNKDSLDPAIIASTKKLRTFFDELPLNTKYVVTYPNLLMFAYYAKKFDYSEVVAEDMIRGGFKIDANLIMREMMDGKVPPLYTFTDYELDDKGISKLEMMYAVYYAIKGGLLKLYNVDPLDWFNRISDAYLHDDTANLRKWSDILYKVKNSGTDQRDFENLCAILDSSDNKTRFDNSLKLEDVFRNTFEGKVNYYSRNLFRKFLFLFSPEIQAMVHETFPEALEIIRTDVNPKLRNLHLLRSLFVETGMDPSIIAKMDSLLKSTDDMRQFIFKSYQELEKLGADCAFKLAKAEDIRRSELLNMELEYQRHIHLALHALNSIAGKGETLDDLKRLIPSHPILSEPFFSGLRGNENLYAGITSTLIAAQGLDAVFKKIKGYEQDYRLKAGIQPSNNGVYYYAYRKSDIAIRLASFLMRGYAGLKISFTKDNAKVQLPESLQELKREIYGYSEPTYDELHIASSKEITFEQSLDMFRHANMDLFTDIASWYKDMITSTRFMRDWMRTKVTAFKLSHEMESDPANLVACDAACRENAKKEMRIGAQKLIDFNLKVLDYFNLNSTVNDDLILGWIGQKTYFDYWITGPSNYFINPENADYRYLSFADEPYNYIISYHLGRKPLLRKYRKFADAETSGDYSDVNGGSAMGERNAPTQEDLVVRPNAFEDAVEFRDPLRKQKDGLLFPIESLSLAKINATFVEPISQEMRLAGVFEDTVAELQTTIKVPTMQFDKNAPKHVTTSWISSNLTGNYHEEIRQYNGKTYNQFLPSEYKNDPRWTTLLDSKQ